MLFAGSEPVGVTSLCEVSTVNALGLDVSGVTGGDAGIFGDEDGSTAGRTTR